MPSLLTRRWLQNLALSTLTMLATFTGAMSWAQSDYPNRPIKMVVAFPPGGTSDVLGRMMADELTKVLKQPVVVENIGGAGGIVGMDRALKMPADCYTIIQTGVGQNAVAHGLDPNLKYNPITDFSHTAQVNSGPNVLVVHPLTPSTPLQDLVDYPKRPLGTHHQSYTPPAPGLWSGSSVILLLRSARV